MAPKPQLRLSRPDGGKGTISLDSPEFQAFIGGGRGGGAAAEASEPAPSAPPPAPPPVVAAAPAPAAAAQVMPAAAAPQVHESATIVRAFPAAPLACVPDQRERSPTSQPFQDDGGFGDLGSLEDESEGIQAIGVRLPELVARKLDRLAEAWLCHRHQIMLNLLGPRLHELAAAIERGERPRIAAPAIAKATRRRAITLRLTPEQSADLERIVARHGSIRSMVLTRLLIPAIDTLFEQEVGQGTRTPSLG